MTSFFDPHGAKCEKCDNLATTMVDTGFWFSPRCDQHIPNAPAQQYRRKMISLIALLFYLFGSICFIVGSVLSIVALVKELV